MPIGIYKRTKPAWNKGISIFVGEKNPFYGKKHTIKTKEKLSLLKIGKRLSPKTEFKRGNIPYNWKGDDVGYCSLHQWIYSKLGQPDTCEHCGKSGLKGKEIDWANKDHKYKRNLIDWLRLCKSCHRTFDISKNQYRKIK